MMKMIELGTANILAIMAGTTDWSSKKVGATTPFSGMAESLAGIKGYLDRFLGVSATSAQVPVFFFLAIFLATFGSILFAAIIFSPRSQPGRSRSSGD